MSEVPPIIKDDLQFRSPGDDKEFKEGLDRLLAPMRKGKAPSSCPSPTLNDLDCLVTWPRGTVGEHNDRFLIEQLLSLCQLHGFGRVPQLAAQIEEIWRDPARCEVYERSKVRHLQMMDEARKLSQP